jgi:hypothetical protein
VVARLGLWLASLGSTLLRVATWLALAFVAAGLALAIVRALRGRREGENGAPLPDPGLRVGRDLRPESLPDDVVGEARARFARGDAAGALSLLYRGALVHLVARFGLALPASATEGECERIAHDALEPGIAGDFRALSRAWLFCAYAHAAPAPEAFAELCERWQPRLRSAA